MVCRPSWIPTTISMIIWSQVKRSSIVSGVLYREVRAWHKRFTACRVARVSLLFGMVFGVRGVVILKEDENLSLSSVTSKSSGWERMVGMQMGGKVRQSSI